MAETIVIIAIPVITLVVTSVVVIRDELKTQKSREAMFEECKRCPLYGGDENAKLRELCSALYEFAYDECPDSAELNFSDRMRELGIEANE